MKIQQVEEQVGITKKNIRFYEREGLLTPGRSENGYRDYSPEDVETLKKIRLLRSLFFPLEDIRRLQSGSLTVEDAARRQIITLERRQASLGKAVELCRELQEHRETLQTLDADAYLEKMLQMKREGVIFMDVKKQDHRKAYVGPVIAAAFMIAFMGAVLFLMIFEVQKERPDAAELFFIAFVAAMLLAVVVGILLALRERIRQIKGGEEDAAAKY